MGDGWLVPDVIFGFCPWNELDSTPLTWFFRAWLCMAAQSSHVFDHMVDPRSCNQVVDWGSSRASSGDR